MEKSIQKENGDDNNEFPFRLNSLSLFSTSRGSVVLVSGIQHSPFSENSAKKLPIFRLS